MRRVGTARLLSAAALLSITLDWSLASAWESDIPRLSDWERTVLLVDVIAVVEIVDPYIEEQPCSPDILQGLRAKANRSKKDEEYVAACDCLFAGGTRLQQQVKVKLGQILHATRPLKAQPGDAAVVWITSSADRPPQSLKEGERYLAYLDYFKAGEWNAPIANWLGDRLNEKQQIQGILACPPGSSDTSCTFDLDRAVERLKSVRPAEGRQSLQVRGIGPGKCDWGQFGDLRHVVLEFDARQHGPARRMPCQLLRDGTTIEPLEKAQPEIVNKLLLPISGPRPEVSAVDWTVDAVWFNGDCYIHRISDRATQKQLYEAAVPGSKKSGCS